MILRIEDLKEVCSKILFAVDTTLPRLELKTVGKTLLLSVTNKEYYVKVKLELEEENDFHVTIDADLFLKLISKTTTDTVELTIKGNTLVVNGNGVYKFPIVYEDSNILELPEINIENETTNFDIDGEILTSILNYNSKEVTKNDKIVKPVQKLYYIDEKGAITFTSGACVNNFTLQEPIKILLNQKIVRLFKLFKGDSVHFTLGYDAVSSDLIKTKVRFENSDISITAILPSDNMLLASVPVEAIRNRASQVYPYSVSIDRDEFIQTINRLLLFSTSNDFTKSYGIFEFQQDYVIIKGNDGINTEKLYYVKPLENCSHNCMLDLLDIKITLEKCSEKYLTVNFGDGQAIVVSRGNIYNVIPEVTES